MEISDKDVYELIVHSSDDRTVLEMLSVKKFNNDEVFYRVLLKRYPYLIAFRKEGEKWKSLYLRMIYHIEKLKEDFDFPYINYKNFNPVKEYKRFVFMRQENDEKIEKIWEIGLRNAVRADRLDLIQYFLNKGAKNISEGYGIAVFFNNLDLMKFFESLNENIDYNEALIFAAHANHMSLVKYLIEERGATNYNFALSKTNNWNIIEYLINEKGADDFNEALGFAGNKENWRDLVDYYIEKGANDFNKALVFASYFENIQMMKYMIDKGANVFYKALDIAIFNGKMESIKYLIEEINKLNIQINLQNLLRSDIVINLKENLKVVKYFIETYPGRFNIKILAKRAKEKGKNNLYNYLQNKVEN
jgi:ankyrin repeat protein